MESYSKLFEGLQQPAQPRSSRSTSEISATILAEITSLKHTLQKLITKVDNIEHRIKEVEKNQKQIHQTYFLPTLPHHSRVVLKPSPGAPKRSTRRPFIM